MRHVPEHPQVMIDRIAKQMVETIRPLLEESGTPIPRRRTLDGHFAESFYASARQELESLGFRFLGDFDAVDEDVGAKADLFYRLLSSDDGTIYAKVLAAPENFQPAIRAVAFCCRFSDDSSMTTWHNWPPRFPVAPQFEEWFVDSEDALGVVLAGHRSHLVRTGRKPVPFASVEDIFAFWTRQERITIAWRKAQGMHFYELFLRRLNGPLYDDSGAFLMESIRAHPWWITGGKAA